jgi:homopolymeric O-antigen transport system permease protein
MLSIFRELHSYRVLIQILVVRDLKARYRGSTLGLLWTLLNPLLHMAIYALVFSVYIRNEMERYPAFLLCGILPWTWFSSSLLEASNVLIAGGNLIRKVLFPAEVLPIVTVLAGLVHFFLGLPILAAFLIYYRVPVYPTDLLWFPVIVLVQLVLTLGLALIVAALTVHFRDVRDLLANLLTLWFFATPIIYPLSQAPANVQRLLNLNPFTHLAVSYQEVLFKPGPFTEWPRLLAVGAGSVVVFLVGYFVFDRLRDTLAEEV